MNRRHPIAVILVVAAVGFAACGDDDAATTATEAPTTTEAPAVVQTTGAPATTTAPATTADPTGALGEEWTPEFIDSFVDGCV
ncbi:MAG: hypothetical protein MUP76_09015, partial [Acidimicrobiia bacterium]|nr:hypothetical protein [Acidimicrobiia bacterium]